MFWRSTNQGYMGFLTKIACFLASSTLVYGYWGPLPDGFNTSQWAFISYSDASVAVLPGSFNRSVFEAAFESNTSDSTLTEA